MQLYSLNSGGRVSAKAGALIDRKSAAKRCFAEESALERIRDYCRGT